MAESPDPITPIFIFSLARSGSTLMQRILATHPDVATAGETWLLLPFLYARRPQGSYAEYAHDKAYRGIQEFCEGLPGGESDFLREIREMALRLYRARAGGQARFFVDKTPRYHVLASDIVRLFPDGRFIFLWRNPLATISSLIDTWGKGRWNVYEYEFDLFDGLPALIRARELAGERGCSLQFRELVDKSSGAIPRVFGYLGLGFDATRSASFATVQLPGGMWDPTGTRLYKELSQAPRDRWKTTLASPLRKWWCRRYLRWLGKERLAVMGYDLDELLAGLAAAPSRGGTLLSDFFRMLLGPVVRAFEPGIMRDKLTRLRQGGRLYQMR